jgi:hypothetical protein
MPLHNHFYLLQQPGGQVFSRFPLMQDGPLLDVEIHVPLALADLLTQQKKPVPKPVAGKAMIDTGASISAVDDSVITSLGVQPVGIATVLTPSGGAQQNQYPVRFMFPGTGLPGLNVNLAIGSILRSQGIVALIGRDALSDVVFIYNGPGGFITFAL